MAGVPAEIEKLVERFGRNAEAYRSTAYNEEQLRVEFINPFWKALGWDVDNLQGNAPGYREVVLEEALRAGGGSKAPDYSFRFGGAAPTFFVEAKRPGVDLKHDPSPAYQLRRYAWSQGLPVSVLTDFEEFAVYDCTVRPKPADKASVARILYVGYTEYAERWDQIASVFAREAVRVGDFGRFAGGKRPRRGTTQVDAELLKEIEHWREELAWNFALRNPGLSVRDLNFAVQKTIDRIIFLRMCEDRGIENYSQLQGLVAGPNIYPRLVQIYRRADQKYNSGLFHFEAERDRAEAPDELTLNLSLDDKVLKDILGGLYYPQSPYEFSVLPVEILGNVYEQFLGKVIRLTAGHHAKVEEKPGVRKAGGVYYTPKYIVDYIVKQTVGKLLEGKTVAQASELRVLDPACGSGSFLLGAYQYLLDWHRDRYVEQMLKTGKVPTVPTGGNGRRRRGDQPALFEGPGGEWRLTTTERKRILLNNLYGVDIDAQAVEVTKLSLLLKVLEGENRETLEKQLRIFRERALPDLGKNIRCGNSLIGPDFFKGRQRSLLDEEEVYRVNPFDWNDPERGFGDIMRAGGFDAVIGNPPYVRVRIFKELYPDEAEYLQRTYACATHVWDVYLLFFEKALGVTRDGGLASFIVPVQTLHQPNCESLRRMLLGETRVLSVADLSELRVFGTATVKNCIIVCEKGTERASLIGTARPSEPRELAQAFFQNWPQDAARKNPGYSLKLDLLSPKKDLCERLRAKSWTLKDLFYVTFGMRSCAPGKGSGGKGRLVTSDPNAPNAKPYMEGRDIDRYCINRTGRFISYLPDQMYSPRRPELFENIKMVSRSMLSNTRLVATIDYEGFYVEQSLVCVIPHGILTKERPVAEVPLEFALAVLNSALETFYFSTYVIDYSLGGGLIHATPGSQGELVVPRCEARHFTVGCALVERMLELHKRKQEVRTPEEKTMLDRQIAATDREIDELVYELYGLTEEEIRIVEQGSR